MAMILATSMGGSRLQSETRRSSSSSASCIWVAARGAGGAGGSGRLVMCSASSETDPATAAQQLVAELAVATGQMRRGRAAAQVLDAWSQEREQWAAAVAAERARWRRRVGGTAVWEHARWADAVWEHVRARMGEWKEEERRALGMFVAGLAAAEEVPADDVERLERVAEEWVRKEEGEAGRRWRQRAGEAEKEVKRMVWEVAEYRLGKWDAEDGAAAVLVGGGSAAGVSQPSEASKASDEERKKKEEEEVRAEVECVACSGLPSRGYRRAMLRAYMDSSWEVGSEGSSTVLREYLDPVLVKLEKGGRLTVAPPIPE